MPGLAPVRNLCGCSAGVPASRTEGVAGAAAWARETAFWASKRQFPSAKSSAFSGSVSADKNSFLRRLGESGWNRSGGPAGLPNTMSPGPIGKFPGMNRPTTSRGGS